MVVYYVMYEKFMVKQIANCVSLSESESVWGDTAAAAVNQRSFRGGGLVTTGDPLVAAGEQCSAGCRPGRTAAWLR